MKGFDLNYKKLKRIQKLDEMFVLANKVKDNIDLLQKITASL